MKLLVAFCVLAVVGLSLADTVLYPRGCIYALGKCVRECEEGTRAYTTGCGPLKPEPSCDEPNPVEGRGSICDFSACYCESPTVRDKKSGKCVPLEQCPKSAVGDDHKGDHKGEHKGDHTGEHKGDHKEDHKGEN